MRKTVDILDNFSKDFKEEIHFSFDFVVVGIDDFATVSTAERSILYRTNNSQNRQSFKNKRLTDLLNF
ncbi:hypothetical protein BpHYR1_024934 [Brachionus plicatilis]|uniref:Uncharacterized protein n=1 Tax=Brachionus plicatilis TaxID=10195 RepID=A0A3M7SI07_BRAPC|nr:hypothetical protein BpHYR1_024934 [Brachionus plicatilis]